MTRNLAETVMGAVVIIVAAGFLWFFLTTADVQSSEGYDISAKFAKVGGLQPGSDVRISGIKVGTVKAQSLDARTFEAVVIMTIRADVKLPKNTVAAIASAGLVGGKYVRLKPGNAPDQMASGDAIQKSEDYRSLEDQVGEIIFLATGGGNGPN